MNRCETFEVSISALLDAELDAGLVVPTIDHLTDCASCLGFYRDARALDDLVLDSGLPERLESAPDRVWQRIASRSVTDEATGATSRSAGWRSWVGRAAVLLVVAGAVWALSQAPWNSSGPGEVVEVVVEGDAGRMTDDRFIALTTEVLRADRRYHRKMVEVLETVGRSLSGREGPSEDAVLLLRESPDLRGPDGERGGEPASRAGDRS